MKEEEAPLNEYEIENAHRVAYLIAGYLRKTLTKAEFRELNEWVETSGQNEELFESMINEDNRERVFQWYENLNTEQRLQRLKSRLHTQPHRRKLWSIAVAASLVIVAGVASYWLFLAPKAPPATAGLRQEKQSSLNRASGKVRLTLADGRMLSLDSAADGRLGVGGDATVIKEGSSLSYEAAPDNIVVNHTLSTGIGGQYRLTLPDGTAVWLNAQSSLRFPTAFPGGERRVELSGEGYFEVAKDPSRPFRVVSGEMNVEVLGTHFNVNTYGDEGLLKTTLLEGSVRISDRGNSRLLTPGEQARVKDGKIEVLPGDTKAAVSWKTGQFAFNGTPLSSVFKELERWYGIPFENTNAINDRLTATLSRSLSLQKVLELLEKTGEMRFRTDGKKVLVSR